MHGDRWAWEKSKQGWGLQHDWEMFDRPTAMVRLRGAEECRFDGCRFALSGATGIRLDLHCQRNSIQNSLIEYVGGVGVVAVYCVRSVKPGADVVALVHCTG